MHTERVPRLDETGMAGDDDLCRERGAVTCEVVGVTNDLAAADIKVIAVGVCVAETQADYVTRAALIEGLVVLLDGVDLRRDFVRGQGHVHPGPAGSRYNGACDYRVDVWDVVDALDGEAEGEFISSVASRSVFPGYSVIPLTHFSQP